MPQIDNGQIVWHGHNGDDSEIFLYDGESIIQLTDNEYPDEGPQIDDDQVTWQGWDGNDWEIFFYDGTSVIQVTDNEHDDRNPQIDNGQVVWDYGYSRLEIYLYDGESTVQFTDNDYTDQIPQIDNGQILWTGRDNNDLDIFLFDGEITTKLSDNEYEEYEAHLDKGEVVWQEHDGYDYEIFHFDGESIIQITDNEDHDYIPQIDNGRIVWNRRTGIFSEIYLFDGESAIQISNNEWDVNPKLDGNHILWERKVDGYYQIVLYHDETTIQLTDAEYNSVNPQIDDGKVVWVTDNELYYYDGETTSKLTESHLNTNYEDWPMFRQNPSHTGYTPGEYPVKLAKLWEQEMGDWTNSGPRELSPVIFDNRLYAVAADDNLRCYDAETGELLWKYYSGESSYTTPLIFEDKIYVGFGDVVCCLDVETGTHQWSVDVGFRVSAAPTISDNRLFVTSIFGRVHCIDLDLVSLVWTRGISGYSYSSPVVSGDKLYVGGEYDTVTCIDVISGEKLWSFGSGENREGSPSIYEERLYVGSLDGGLYCVDKDSGMKIWEFSTGGGITSTPAIHDGRVYFGSHDYNVYSVDAVTGQEYWRYSTDGEIEKSVTISDNALYVPSQDQLLYCLDPVTGEKLGEYSPYEYYGGSSSPVLVSGRIYLEVNSRYLVCLGEAPPELSPWTVSCEIQVGEGYSDEVEFGMREYASDHYDSHIGEMIAPPSPPVGISAYCWYPDEYHDYMRKLSTSYHYLDYPSIWTIGIDAIGIQGDARISWDADDIGQIPLKHQIWLDTPDGEINMRTTQSYEWDAVSGQTYTFTVRTFSVEQVTIELMQGWNQISIPLHLDDPSVDSVLAGVDYAQILRWTGEGYEIASEFSPGEGYWILVLEDTSFSVTGIPITTLTFELDEGWNLMGGGHFTCSPNDITISHQLVRYEDTNYVTCTQIEPSKGYWMLVFNDRTITVSKDLINIE